ncbi:hypothetical protein E3O25_14550 [Cryobacterium sp. TMT1-3]|uniref:Uncharacterized protein n=1 Tax=Cryobacterium luteum TaxID=1424661 RepID=A0A1H8A468_9MICO|nr:MULTISPECIES: hypothetical protein [Cryobacterium]TFB88378.1 hypothetical protein E3O10_11195 [Cryobacterium luteum]TFC24406.1 hypothetical protein E3O25_14550 [Cryobacterium sp. TMT1-3]SEM65381.1 hypothetical protein SAMN05216281_10116 [Cryobacterium luteum]
MTRATPTPRRPRAPASASQQRLDPIGGLAAWPLAPVVAVIVVTYAVVATTSRQHEIQLEEFAAAAVAVLIIAAAVLVWSARPDLAPFTRTRAVMIVALGLTAHLLAAASTWQLNGTVQDDFAPIGLGLLMLALAPFRPWKEILVLGTGSALTVGITALAQSPFLGIQTPPMLFAIIAMTQVLAPTLASAAYSRQVVNSIHRWQTDARRAIRARTEASRGLLATEVVDHRLKNLGADVLPFLADVLERQTLTAADIKRARSLAFQVRRVLVAEVDHTWLDDLIDRERAALTARGLTPLCVIADPERRATGFDSDQRAAVAALIVALCRLKGFDPTSLVVQIDGSGAAPADTDQITQAFGQRGARPTPATDTTTMAIVTAAQTQAAAQARAQALAQAQVHAATTPRTPGTAAPRDTITIQAGISLPPFQRRRALRPYLSVLRSVFTRVRVTSRHPLLTLEFDAERFQTKGTR